MVVANQVAKIFENLRLGQSKSRFLIKNVYDSIKMEKWSRGPK